MYVHFIQKRNTGSQFIDLTKFIKVYLRTNTAITLSDKEKETKLVK